LHLLSFKNEKIFKHSSKSAPKCVNLSLNTCVVANRIAIFTFDKSAYFENSITVFKLSNVKNLTPLSYKYFTVLFSANTFIKHIFNGLTFALFRTSK